MTQSQDIKTAEDHLIKLDPVLGRLIELQRPIAIEPRPGYFFSLCRSVVSQQLSVTAASAIFGRFQQATGLNPRIIVGTSDAQLRELGLSRQKISYIRDLTRRFVESPKTYEHLDELSDDEVIEELTQVKGIGIWTAQMFLIFTLNRPDVFAPDDIGLQRAIKIIYKWDDVPSKQELAQFAERWKPYRTIACRHLWKSLHNSPA